MNTDRGFATVSVFRTMNRAILPVEAVSLHFRDALLVATMQENGIAATRTADARFSKIPGLVAKNPFLAG